MGCGSWPSLSPARSPSGSSSSALLAEGNKSPLDILDAESELIAAYNVEYSGIKFALFYAGEYAHTLGAVRRSARPSFSAATWGPRFSRDSSGSPQSAPSCSCSSCGSAGACMRLRIDQAIRLNWMVLFPACARERSRRGLLGLEAVGMPADATILASGRCERWRMTLRNVFRPANTVPYPRKKRAIPRQWRAGSFALTFDPKTGEENCIGCRLCEYICPSRDHHGHPEKGRAAPERHRARRTATRSCSTTRPACSASCASRSARPTRS